MFKIFKKNKEKDKEKESGKEQEKEPLGISSKLFAGLKKTRDVFVSGLTNRQRKKC